MSYNNTFANGKTNTRTGVVFFRMQALKYYKNPVYYNWDYRADRKDLLQDRLPSKLDLIIFDEIRECNFSLTNNFSSIKIITNLKRREDMA